MRAQVRFRSLYTARLSMGRNLLTPLFYNIVKCSLVLRNDKLSFCFVRGIHRVQNRFHRGMSRTLTQTREALTSPLDLIGSVWIGEVFTPLATPYSIPATPISILKTSAQGGSISASVFRLCRNSYDL